MLWSCCEYRMANTSLFNLYLIWGAWGRIQDKLKKSEAIETRSPNPKLKPLSCSNPSLTLKHGGSYSAHEHWLGLKPMPWLTAWHHTSQCVCAHMHVLGTEPRALSISGKCSTAGDTPKLGVFVHIFIFYLFVYILVFQDRVSLRLWSLSWN